MIGPTPQPAPRRSLRTWLVVGAVVALAVLLAVVFYTRFGKDPRVVEAPPLWESAPDLRLEYLDGTGSITFAELQGRVVVVNFWASWCVPNCRYEHPLLLAAQAAYRDRGVQFVGVVYQDTVAAANAFLDELGRGDGYLYVLDPDQRAEIEFGVRGVPETFLVSPEGRVVDKIVGPVLSYEELAAALEAVLQGTAD